MGIINGWFKFTWLIQDNIMKTRKNSEKCKLSSRQTFFIDFFILVIILFCIVLNCSLSYFVAILAICANVTFNICLKRRNMLTAPLLIVNGLAAIVCQLKNYWIAKYNNGLDISE